MPTNDMPLYCRACREGIDRHADIRFCRQCGREGCCYCMPDKVCDSCEIERKSSHAEE